MPASPAMRILAQAERADADAGSTACRVRRTRASPGASSVTNKVTSPQGEEFVLADESVNRVLVKGVTAVLRARTEQLWSTKEGDMFLFADAEGNLVPGKGGGAGLYYRDCRFLSDLVMRVDSRDPLLLSTSGGRAYRGHV